MGCEERAFSNPWPTCVGLGRWWWGAPGEELGHLCPDQELCKHKRLSCSLLYLQCWVVGTQEIFNEGRRERNGGTR